MTCIQLCDSFVAAEATTGRDATFWEVVASNRELGATCGIDAALEEHQLDALVLPVPAQLTTMAAAFAGYPLVTGALNVLHKRSHTIAFARFLLSSDRTPLPWFLP